MAIKIGKTLPLLFSAAIFAACGNAQTAHENNTGETEIAAQSDTTTDDAPQPAAMDNSGKGAAILAMCDDQGEPGPVCSCGVAELRKEIGDDDFIVFNRIVAEYRAGQARGEMDGAAWQNAVSAEATRADRTQDDMTAAVYKLGESFQKAVAACGGKTQ
ncbi:hypothetical protein [Hyphococcus sp.]|uniref:hypothetical protein n=1 Tax=Hyphococcus sp. TaxID=2038636 RepID=UPI003CCBF1B0